jgi:hypothetical protein
MKKAKFLKFTSLHNGHWGGQRNMGDLLRKSDRKVLALLQKLFNIVCIKSFVHLFDHMLRTLWFFMKLHMCGFLLGDSILEEGKTSCQNGYYHVKGRY